MARAEADRGDDRAARRAAEARAERAEAALASLRHAALFAAGVRGGPHAWRWAYDPAGTTLSDESAWERLLGEMRERTAEKAELEASLARGECQSCGYAPCMCDYQ